MSISSDKTQKVSSIIRREQAGAFNSWKAPEVTGQAINKDNVDARSSISGSSSEGLDIDGPVTAQSLEEITKQAYDEGLQQGIEEGRKEGLRQQQEKIQTLSSINESVRKKSTEFDQVITEQLLDITIAIAKQIIRRELTTTPEEVMGVIREAIALMPDQSSNIILKLHPEDAILVREIYDVSSDSDLSWKIFEDPGIHRGGCILSSDSSEINAELNQRIQVIVNNLLGGERSSD